MGRAHGLGISTTCYPSPAPVHGLLSSDDERPKLCPWVQTPAPVLGRLHATVPGILAVLVVHRTGREIALQPPASDQPSQCGSRWTLPDLVVGSTPLHNPAARSVLLDLKAYYETHDQAKATDANCKKLLSSYTDDEIFKALERKYKSPLMRAIDLDDF